jgi:peptide deformylase
MVLPIYLYGHPVLKKKAQVIDASYPDLKNIIQNMWDTMYFAHGVGLAAPQIGLSIRIFMMDTLSYYEDRKVKKGIKKVFINPQVVDQKGEIWTFEEGCLSIPNIHADVDRTTHVRIKYQDESFNLFEEEFDEINARVILHEYDHIEGTLFIERIHPMRKQLLQRKLDKIKKGQIEAKYPVKNA